MASGSIPSKTKFRLKSSDDKVIEVEKAIAMQFKILKVFTELVPARDEIPLLTVDSKTLLQVISWCEKRIDKKISKVDLETWDRQFLNVDTDVLYDLLMASNYLEIRVLLEQVCDKIGDLIKGKTPDEIRRTFNIENDFSPEEDAQLRNSYSWAFDPSS